MKLQNNKSWQKGFALLLGLLLANAVPVMAQEDVETEQTETESYGTESYGTENGETESVSKADQSFSFVYIAQDNTLDSKEIKKKLDAAWSRAVQDNPTIFYLARGMEEPIVVKVSVPGDDNRGDYDEVLVPALDEESFGVDGQRDKERILRLLQSYEFIGADKNPLYKETFFEFHIGQNFWTDGFNEILLASLFFELNIMKYIPDGFHFNVFCPKTVSYNEDAGPFGYLNPDDCRRYVNLERSY